MTVILFNSVLIVLLMCFIAYRVTIIWYANNSSRLEIMKLLNDIWQKLDNISQQLDDIEHNVHDDITDDRRDIVAMLKSINDVVDDLRDNRILDKLKELDKPPFNIPMDLPCYHPDGICMNPHMDCINCPKRCTGGTWSTSTNLNK